MLNLINKTIGKSHNDQQIRKLIYIFFTIIQNKEIILRTEFIENSCIQLLVKNSKTALPFYIF